MSTPRRVVFSLAIGVIALPGHLAWADDGTGNIACPVEAEDIQACDTQSTLLPDLVTVVPKHLSVQNKQQAEQLRFSNGMANLGFGPWWLEPEFPTLSGGEQCQRAYQLLPSAAQFPNRHILPTDEQVPAPGWAYTSRCQKGKFDFHETHNHWHIANVGEFKVCHNAQFHVGVDGNGKALVNPDCAPVERIDPQDGHAQALGIKFTFCLIDWYKLGDNAPQSDPTRNFFACETGFQGVAPGWTDQYHHATDGQSITITGIAAGRYVLVSRVNGKVFKTPLFEEMNTNNNASWLVFDLLRDSAGNPKIQVVDNACGSAYSYLSETLEPTVDAFIDYYHPGDIALKKKIMSDMCGQRSLNR